MVGVELEQAFHNAIERILTDDEKIEEVKKYFKYTLVVELIEDILGE